MELVHSIVSPEEVLITPELDRRATAPPDVAAESRALLALAREMAANPRALPRKVVELAAGLCRAETVGISLIETDGGDCLRWEAVVGPLERRAGSRVPRPGSLCGATLDRKTPQLFSRPTHYFAGHDGTLPPVGEGLVVPLAADEAAVGTVWVVAHDRERRFDAGDVRVLSALAAFTAAALRTASSADAARAAQTEAAERAGAALEGRTRALETVNRVNIALAGELDLERLVQAVTEAGAELSGAEFGAFFYNAVGGAEESYTLYTLAGAPREAFAKFPMPRNTPLFEATFRGEGVVRLDDVMADPRYGRNPPHRGCRPGICRSGATSPSRSSRGPGECSGDSSSGTRVRASSPPRRSGP